MEFEDIENFYLKNKLRYSKMGYIILFFIAGPVIIEWVIYIGTDI